MLGRALRGPLAGLDDADLVGVELREQREDLRDGEVVVVGDREVDLGVVVPAVAGGRRPPGRGRRRRRAARARARARGAAGGPWPCSAFGLFTRSAIISTSAAATLLAIET